MEEYFPPLGTEHQIILDERRDGTRFFRWQVLLPTGLVLMLLGLIAGWIWQGRVTFAVPATPVSAVLTTHGQKVFSSTPPPFIPPEWHAPSASRWTILLGGGPERPSWLLAPFWVRTPEGFVTIERHGLYRLSALASVPPMPSPTHTLSLHEAKKWLENGFMAARIEAPGIQPDPFTITWDGRRLTTSLPLSAHGELSDRYDVSYALQGTDLDEAFLQSVLLNFQGLGSWRRELERVSWSGEGADRAWELVAKAPTSPLLAAIGQTPSATTTELLTLDDGTGARTYLPSTEPPSSTKLTLGPRPEPSSVRCRATGFTPILRVRGATLKTLTDRLLGESSGLTTVEVGSQDGRLALCLETNPRVDK